MELKNPLHFCCCQFCALISSDECATVSNIRLKNRQTIQIWNVPLIVSEIIDANNFHCTHLPYLLKNKTSKLHEINKEQTGQEKMKRIGCLVVFVLVWYQRIYYLDSIFIVRLKYSTVIVILVWIYWKAIAFFS